MYNLKKIGTGSYSSYSFICTLPGEPNTVFLAPHGIPFTVSDRNKAMSIVQLLNNDAAWQPCPGEAHKNPYIDHCPVCMDFVWGWTLAVPESEVRNVQMYGVTLARMQSEKPRFVEPASWAMSILSDVQELLAHDDGPASREAARQWINVAKYWIGDVIRLNRPDKESEK